jgi:hypothetical protein
MEKRSAMVARPHVASHQNVGDNKRSLRNKILTAICCVTNDAAPGSKANDIAVAIGRKLFYLGQTTHE